MSEQQAWRLIFRKDGRLYKMIRFWGFDKDSTLFLKIYSNGPLLETMPKFQTISNIDGVIFQDAQITYDEVKNTNFYANKQSFHPSGIQHINDNHGNRYEDGAQGIPFQEIKTFIQLAHIFPKNPLDFPEVFSCELRNNDVVLDLDDNKFRPGPFEISIYLFRGDVAKITLPEKYSHEDLLVNVDIICGSNEKYRLLVRCFQKEIMVNKPFPPLTYVFTFNRNQKS